MQPPKLPYKKIPLQSLQPRRQLYPTKVSQKQLSLSMNKKFTWSSKPLLYYTDSGLGDERIIHNNGVFAVSCFFDAFLNAYTQHGDVVLVPDQVWIMVQMYWAKYVDKHAEKLRSKIVMHQGIKTLTVIQTTSTTAQSTNLQKSWQSFFPSLLTQIKSSTLPNTVQSICCNFSTTTPTYSIISTAILMNSLQKYFNYHRRFCVCGINNVYMAGVREDWVKMVEMVEGLVRFDVDGELRKYVEHMRVILENFVKTFDQEPDVEWWNTVMKSYEKTKVYGGEKTEVDGWILHFYGIYQETQIHGFPQMIIKVPIQLINEVTGIEKSLQLVVDWVSISKPDETSYKPDIGLCIFELNSKQIKKQQNPTNSTNSQTNPKQQQPQQSPQN